MKRFVRSYKTRFIKNAAEFAKHYKRKLQCSCCEFSLEPAALHFHHINPKDKKYELTKLLTTGDVELLLQELSICTVLCANCHAIYHFSEDVEVVNTIAISFKPVDLDNFLQCVEEFGQHEETVEFEFADDIELQFEKVAPVEIVIPMQQEEYLETKSKAPKRFYEDLTVEDKELICTMYHNDCSLKRISRTIFGDSVWGGFYNEIIRTVVEESGAEFIVKYNNI